MLISDIITLVDDQTDEIYDNGEWVTLINQCLDDLTPIAKMINTYDSIAITVASKRASIAIASDTNLPNVHEIVNLYYTPNGGKETRLKRLVLNDSYSKGWKLDSGKIYLQGLGTEVTGTVRVDAYKKLTHIVYVASPESYTPTSPDLPEQYHGLIVSYLCAKCQQREEEPSDKQDFWNDYMTEKQNFTIDRIKQMEPWKLKNLQAQTSSKSK